jgi:hypothetical protein
MQNDLDTLPMLTPRQAYMAMVEFLRVEFELAGNDKIIHLGGLLAEIEPQSDGTSADPGGVQTFADAITIVTSPTYTSAWSHNQNAA